MLNRHNFVPAKYRQPDYYRLIFGDWTAVYKIGGGEYHVRLVHDWRNKNTARSVEILSQGAGCRSVIVSDIPSVKQAMERLDEIIGSGRRL